MAVAVTTKPETAAGSSNASLASASLAGAAYVIATLAVVAFGVPYLWGASVATWLEGAPFVERALLIVVELFAVGLLVFVGLMMVGGKPRAGLKAGIATALMYLLLLALVVTGVGMAFHSLLGDVVATLFGVAILYLAVRTFSSPRFESRMQSLDAQGWFSATSYKPNQGRKVRRATLLGALVVLACGIYTLINHGTLDAVGQNWVFRVPFAHTLIPLLPDVRYTMPLLLAALAGWMCYRVVNQPTFAEFLIATEGELNKIAWPTRRSLWQDTVVVLSTVVLMTLFLLVVDVAWGKILSHPWINVLKLDTGKGEGNQVQDIKELDW